MEEQIERRRVFAQDQSLPNRATTFHQFAQADAQTPRGRFSAIAGATVVGANPPIDYPAGPTWSADPGAQCVEPPLGFDNPAFEPSTALLSSSDEATGPTSDDPSPLGQRSGVSPFSAIDDPATEGLAPPSASPQSERSLADALYPRPSRDQRLWDEISRRVSKHNREALVRGLREANESLRRERGR